MLIQEVERPSQEKLQIWRARWTDSRIGDVVHILKTHPKTAIWRIRKLHWYSEENGFEKWVDRDAYANDWMSSLYKHNPHHWRKKQLPWFVLDLRGLKLEKVDAENARLNFANLSGAILHDLKLKNLDLSHATLSSSEIWNVEALECDLFATDGRWMFMRDVHFHEVEFSMSMWHACTIAFSNFCKCRSTDTGFADAHINACRFYGGEMVGASLIGTNLDNCTIVNCSLMHVKFRTPSKTASLFSTTKIGQTMPIKNDCAKRYVMNRIVPRAFSASYKDGTNLEGRVEACSQIRLAFRDSGLFHEAAYYYVEEEMWRTRLNWQQIGKWKRFWKHGNRKDAAIVGARYLLAEKLMGYGEQPGRIITLSFIVIFLCGLAFLFFGFELNNKVVSIFVSPVSEWPEHFLRSIRFSIECFTTLGFSKVQPADETSHWIATFEGLVGVLLIAMATVTWARKAIRD